MKKYIVTYVDLNSGAHCKPFAFTTVYDNQETAREAAIEDMEKCADEYDDLNKDKLVLEKIDGTVIVWNVQKIIID